jgi:GTP-binding protein EngB required for normal cell division
LTDYYTDEVRKKHKGRQILVGVEGPTGAGKSSFLGSLLKIPELFPSGQESAATAVIGKASWNWVDDPGREFRAQVFFREKDEIANELESLLKELNHWSGLVAGHVDDYDDDGGEKADTIAMSRSLIEHQLPRIQAVWGMDEEKLLRLARKCPKESSYKNAARTIFPKNFTATKFNASTAEKLSEAIKPFLDSSPSAHGGGNQFSAWPLVKGVHIYVKADILKPGITLVDLPGCGDAVESRSEVAQKVSHTLDVRMVVSPIIRATDEKQGQALMQNGFDEAQMRIRGKLDGRGFCVIASKMDDMKVDSYIHGCVELSHNPEVIQKQIKLADLKDEKAALKETRRDLKVAKKQAESQKKKASKSYDKAKKKHELNLTSKSTIAGTLHTNNILQPIQTQVTLTCRLF